MPAFQPPVPQEEGTAGRAEAEADQRDPFARRWGDRGLESQMRAGREDRGDQAKGADGIRRNGCQAAAGETVAGPDQGRGQCGGVAGNMLRRGHQEFFARDQQAGAGKPGQRACGMPRAQRLARQQGREQDDQQGPKVVDQVGLNRRGCLQGQEKKEMVSEQSANADDLGAGALTERRCQGVSADNPFDEGKDKPDEKGRRDDLEGLYLSGQGGQDRKRAPQKNGARAHQGRATPFFRSWCRIVHAAILPARRG